MLIASPFQVAIDKLFHLAHCELRLRGLRQLVLEQVGHPFINVKLRSTPSTLDGLVKSHGGAQQNFLRADLNQGRWESLLEIAIDRRDVGMLLILRGGVRVSGNL